VVTQLKFVYSFLAFSLAQFSLGKVLIMSG